MYNTIKAALEAEEGKQLTVYRDTTGNLTVGIGHKVIPKDHLHCGERISDEQCAVLFADDITTAYQATRAVYPELNAYPVPIQTALVQMAFQLGQRGLANFIDMHQAILKHEWLAMADAMQHSLWAQETPARAQRLIAQVRSVNASTS